MVPQVKRGVQFDSETDTEVIPKLLKYVYDDLKADKDDVQFTEVRVLHLLSAL